MDYIKKIICIEDARTRTQGLMPYYEFGKEYPQHAGAHCPTDSETPEETCATFECLDLESTEGNDNGNWGQFVANPCFLAKKDKTYEGMLHAYYSLLNMVRNGVKLRKVETKNHEIIFTEDIGAFEWKGECFSGGTEPDFLYDYAAYNAKNFYSTEIDSLREETRHIYRANITVEDDFIVLIEDYEKFQVCADYLNEVTIPSSITDKQVVGTEHTKWASYCKVVDEFIGKINIPASIYNKHIKVPKSMPCADVNSYIKWLEEYPNEDCCNARLWEDMGGSEMLEELRKYEDVCKNKREALEALPYAVPYISMPLLLTQNTTDIGVLTDIDPVEYDDALNGPSASEGEDTRPHGKLQLSQNDSGFTKQEELKAIINNGKCLTIDQIIMEHSANTNGTIEVESMLNTLRSPKKYLDDDNNVLPGKFKQFDNPAGQMYVCIKKSDEVFYKLQVSAQTIVDGEVVDYCLKYVVDEGMTIDEFMQHCDTSNIIQTTPGIFWPNLTQDQATEKLAEEKAKYDAADTSNKYELCVAESAWEMEPIPGQWNADNGDGMESAAVVYPPGDANYRSANGKFYRTITTQAAGIRIAVTEEDEKSTREGVDHDYRDPYKTHYYFFVKYNNTPEFPMDIPFEDGNTANVYLVSAGTEGGTDWIYRGDFIPNSGVDDRGTELDVHYVIGGYFRSDERGTFVEQVYPESGDVYAEKYTIDNSHVDLVPLDGVADVPVYSRYIDFEGAAKEFYSPRYNLYRTGNTANIIRLTTMDAWNKDFAIDAYLAKEEYLTNFSSPPKVDVNVTIDRGGVSAFEKHYKLAECNTMQDLVNYGNNFFNL